MKHFLIKLRQQLQYHNLKGNLHFIVIVIILLLIFLDTKNIFVLLLGLLVLVYIFINNKPLFYITIIITSILLSIYGVKILRYTKAPQHIKGMVKVSDIKINDDYEKVTIYYKGFNYIVYPKEINYDLAVGDIFYIDEKIEKGSSSHYEGGFNYSRYLKYQNTVGIIKVSNIKVIKHSWLSIGIINYELCRYFDKYYNSTVSSFLKALIIGNDNSLDEEIQKGIKIIGISHLFVVSGLHVGIIVTIINKGCDLIKLSKRKTNVITSIFLFIYLLMTKFMVSVIRVCFSYFLKLLDIKPLTSLDYMAINIILVLIINPFYCYSYSFILTYLISTMIIIINPLLRRFKGFFGNLISMIIISVMSIVITLPVVIIISPDINFLSIGYNLFFIPFMSYFLLPFMIILSICPLLNNIGFGVINFFRKIIMILEEVDILTISFPMIRIETVIIYYVLVLFILLMIEKRKYYFISLYIIFLCGWNSKIYLNNQTRITFLDLKEGESTIIEEPYNKINIVIDTGISNKGELTTYLKKRGIKRLDLIVISHGDDDHNGDLLTLVKELRVKKVIIGKYDLITKSLLDSVGYNSYEIVQRGDYFSIDNYSFNILWPYYDNHNPNDNSLVFTLSSNNISILFTGDISSKIEKNLLEKEKEININILKIAHHGSSFSSCKEFINGINFSIGIVMSGYSNIFSFPSYYTKERLKEKEVYYTKDNYTITLKYKRKGFSFDKKWVIFKHMTAP